MRLHTTRANSAATELTLIQLQCLTSFYFIISGNYNNIWLTCWFTSEMCVTLIEESIHNAIILNVNNYHCYYYFIIGSAHSTPGRTRSDW